MQTQQNLLTKETKVKRVLIRKLPFDRKDYFNSKEIADLLGIGYVTIHRWADAGEFLTPVKVSQRKHYWNKHDVFIWIANNPTHKLVRNLDL